MNDSSTSVLRHLSARYTTFTTRQALLVLGLQENIINTAENAPTDSSNLLRNLKELVPSFRKNGDVFWIRTRSSNDQDHALVSPYVADATAIQAPSDTHLLKPDYSAFRTTSLLSILRARFITEVYLAGCFTDLCVYHTAVDAAQYGIQINIVEDCLGFNSPHRHTKALNRMIEDLGAFITTSNTLLDRFGRHIVKEVFSRSPTPEIDHYSVPDLDYDSIRTRESFSIESDSGHPDDSFDLTPGIHEHHEDIHMDQTCVEEHDMTAKDETLVVDECTLTGNLSTPTPKQDLASPLNCTYSPQPVPMEDPAEAIHLDSLGSALNADLVVDSPSTDRREISPESLSRKRRSADLDDVTEETSSTPHQAASPHREEDHVVAIVRKKARRLPDNLATFPTKQPGDTIGCGDTYIQYDLLPKQEADQSFLEILDQVPWQTMSHVSGHVPRLVCCQGEIDSNDASIPIYRHPSDTVLPLIEWSPAVLKARAAAEKVAGHPLNHALIQLYRGGGDFISEHSDKTLDIVPGSNIVNVSLGAQRTMRLRSKRKPHGSSSESTNTPSIDPPSQAGRTTERIPLPHNSIFTLGPATNAHYLHSIQPDKRLPHDLSDQELAYAGARISLIFRHIGTFLSPDSLLIWGRGGIAKTRAEARRTVNGDEMASAELLRAFGRENQNTDLGWGEVYGVGSDVHNLASVLPEPADMIYLSGVEEEDDAVRRVVEGRGREVSFVPPPEVRVDDGRWVTAEGQALPRLRGRDVVLRCKDGRCVYGVEDVVAYLDREDQDLGVEGVREMVKTCTATEA